MAVDDGDTDRAVGVRDVEADCVAVSACEKVELADAPREKLDETVRTTDLEKLREADVMQSAADFDGAATTAEAYRSVVYHAAEGRIRQLLRRSSDDPEYVAAGSTCH